MSKISLKVFVGSNVHRISVPSDASWDQEVHCKLMQLGSPNEKWKIFYQDDEDDWVVVRTSIEWSEAVRLNNDNILRVRLEEDRNEMVKSCEESSESHINNNNMIQSEDSTFDKEEEMEIGEKSMIGTEDHSFCPSPKEEFERGRGGCRRRSSLTLKLTLEKAVDFMKDEIEKLPQDIKNLFYAVQTRFESVSPTLSSWPGHGFRMIAQLAHELHEFGLSKLDDVSSGESAVKILQAAAMIGGRRTPVIWYNAACGLSKIGKQDEAIATLTQAIEFGWSNVELMQKDPDLDFIRPTESFRGLLEAAEKNNEKQSSSSFGGRKGPFRGGRPFPSNAYFFGREGGENGNGQPLHSTSTQNSNGTTTSTSTSDGEAPNEDEEVQPSRSSSGKEEDGKHPQRPDEIIVDEVRKVMSKFLKGFAGVLEGISDELNQVKKDQQQQK